MRALVVELRRCLEGCPSFHLGRSGLFRLENRASVGRLDYTEREIFLTP